MLGINIPDDVVEIRIEDVVSDILNKVPKGTEYNSDGGYIYPGYQGESIMLYFDGQTVSVEWEGDVNCRNSYQKKGERVIDAIIRHRDELGLPSAILLYDGHDAGSTPDEWKLTIYLWGDVGEGLLSKIAEHDEKAVLRALNYPWRPVKKI